MTLENRLTEYLEAKQAAVPARSGDLDTVLRRGRRRTLVGRATYGLAAAAAVAVVIAGASLFVGGDGTPVQPDLVPPAAGGETEVVPGTPGPALEVVPAGTEAPFEDLGAITDADRELFAEYLAETPAAVVYGIGEVSDGTRVFLVTGLANELGEAESCLIGGRGDGAAQFICGPAGPGGSFPGVSFAEAEGAVYGLVPEGAAYVAVTTGADAVWQRPVERAVWLPFGAGAMALDMYDASGRLMLSQRMDAAQEERARVEAMEGLIQEWMAERSRDRMVGQAALTWVNTLGLNRTDPATWRSRLARACVEGVWEPDVARSLAAEFIEADLVVSIRAAGTGSPNVDEGAAALWIMTKPLCPDLFPEGSTPVGASG